MVSVLCPGGWAALLGLAAGVWVDLNSPMDLLRALHRLDRLHAQLQAKLGHPRSDSKVLSLYEAHTQLSAHLFHDSVPIAC